MIDVEIPIKPISVNKAFQGRRFKTADCKSFEEELWYLLPKEKMIKGNVSVTIEFYLKNHKMTDVSNLVKVFEDIVVKRGYIEDDRKVNELFLYKYPAKTDKIHLNITKS